MLRMKIISSSCQKSIYTSRFGGGNSSFHPSGEILYSTNPREIGTINREDYFQEIVA
jgi:hypothetical protein